MSAWKRKRCNEITLQVRRKTAGKPGLFHHISPRFLTKLVCLRRGNSCRLNSFQSTLDPSDVLKKIGIVFIILLYILILCHWKVATLWSMSMKRMLSDVCKWWLFERRTPLAVGQPCDNWWILMTSLNLDTIMAIIYRTANIFITGSLVRKLLSYGQSCHHVNHGWARQVVGKTC